MPVILLLHLIAALISSLVNSLALCRIVGSLYSMLAFIGKAAFLQEKKVSWVFFPFASFSHDEFYMLIKDLQD